MATATRHLPQKTAMNLTDIKAQPLTSLKSFARANNLLPTGDLRLKSVWLEVVTAFLEAAQVKAIALAQSAIQSAGDEINTITGCQLGKSFTTTARASVEAYGIVRAQFVVPVENAIAWTWNTATSESAIALYLNSAVTLMRFCFALYKSGIIARDWCEALVDECLEPDKELWLLPILEEGAIAAVKRFAGQCVDQVWVWDAQYQSAIAGVLEEAQEVFSASQWVVLMVKS